MHRSLIILILSCLGSCNKGGKSSVEKRAEWEAVNMIGKEIDFRDLTFFCDSDVAHCIDILQENTLRFKVITMINGQCGSCINKIRRWNKWDSTYNDNRGIVMIPYSSDSLEVFRFLIESRQDLNHPYYLDLGKNFAENNNIPNENLQMTFLLDQRNRVVFIGDPLTDEGVHSLYMNRIGLIE